MSRRRASGESGASLVEAAFLAPVLFVVLFGMIEMGYLIRDYQIGSDAVSDASRVGALMGPTSAEDGTSPDFHILRSLREATGSVPSGWISRVVVFEAPGPPSGLSAVDQTPDDCKSGTSVVGVCNVYNDPTAAFAAVEAGSVSYFGCPGSSVSCDWEASTRQNGPTVDAIEYLGVWISIERPYITGIFGSVLTIEQASVVRIEAGALSG